ncbi:MAG: DUF4831 family protein, partial [Bacteroidales bacterium]|nr:DUF4831 family protein [Bacteroidales bacterium]
MNTIKFITVIIILSAVSCKAPFYTEKIPHQNSKAEGIIYSLPEAKILVKVEITKEIKQKGIFSDYTHLYFNAKNAILKNETKFYISDISLKTVPVVDSSQVYRIISPKNINPLLLNLSKESFISGINLSDVQASKVIIRQNLIRNNDIATNVSDYADISLYSVREIQYDTIYKDVLRDSVMIKVPIIREKEVYKSKAKQAKETADIIFRLRDDRYALLTGENDGNNFPDGEAIKIMLKKLSGLEKNYMSLFTGREMKVKKNYQLELTPQNKNSEEDNILFYFSEIKGFTNDTIYKPVILKLTNIENENGNIEFQKIKTEESGHYSGIVYRIPAKAKAEIIFDGKELFKTNVFIPQFGHLNIIPSNLFNNQITVEFYPEYGSL